MIKKSLCFVLLMAVMPLMLSAQMVFSAKMSRMNVSVGDRFQIQYSLENATQAGNFNAPAIDGCKTLYVAGPTTYSSYSNINGHVSSEQGIQYTVTYRAEKKGTHTIPSATVESGGKKFTSNSFKITVSDAPANPYSGYGGGHGGNGYRQAPQQSGSQQLAPLTHNDVFVRMSLNKTSVYEQEAVECRITLYTTAQATNLSYNTTPKIDGFLIEDASPTGNIDTQTVTEGGRTYYVYLLRKYILFPQKTGELTISSGEYEIGLVRYTRINAGYYYYQVPSQEDFTTRAVTKTINVKELPSPRPAGFTGGVGSFSVSTELTPDKLLTGALGKLTYTVKGTGNIKYLTAPVPDMPSTFEYDDKPDAETDVHALGSSVTGTQTFTYEFVPQNVGDFSITAGTFVYFDPSKGDYVSVRLPRYDVHVAKGTDTDVAANELLSHEEMKDILPAQLGNHDLDADTVPVLYRWWYWMIWCVTALILLTVIIVYRKQARLRADVIGRKRARANKIARRRFKQARVYMQRKLNDKFYEEMLRAMWGYVSDKLNIPGSKLTRENVAQELASYGVPADVTDKFVSLLDDLELARYTPQNASNSPETLYGHAVDVIDAMESVKTVKPAKPTEDD